MNSSWAKLAASVGKELRSELRSAAGLLTGCLFALCASVALGLARLGPGADPMVAAALLTTLLLFVAVTSLPRVFVIEDEQGSLALLLSISRPWAIFLGKATVVCVTMIFLGALSAVLFLAPTEFPIASMPLLVASLVAESLSLAFGVALCGIIVLGSNNRWLLVGVLAIPLLLPQAAMSVGALSAALGSGSIAGGWRNVVGLLCFALVLGAAGAQVAELLFKRKA